MQRRVDDGAAMKARMAHFEVDGRTPYASALVEKIQTNDSTRKPVEYSGLL